MGKQRQSRAFNRRLALAQSLAPRRVETATSRVVRLQQPGEVTSKAPRQTLAAAATSSSRRATTHKADETRTKAGLKAAFRANQTLAWTEVTGQVALAASAGQWAWAALAARHLPTQWA